jgi:hypothetical protein
MVRVISAALAVVLALGCAGCGSNSGGPATDGPLRGGPFGAPSPGGQACAGARVGQAVTFADEVFTNHSHATVVLDRVALRRPRDMRLLGSYAVPGISMVGVVRGFPPTNSGLPSTWKHRQRVRGFRLAPGRSFNMVLGAAATGAPTARSPGMAIHYHDPAGSYVLEDRFAMLIVVGGRRCH